MSTPSFVARLDTALDLVSKACGQDPRAAEAARLLGVTAPLPPQQELSRAFREAAQPIRDALRTTPATAADLTRLQHAVSLVDGLELILLQPPPPAPAVVHEGTTDQTLSPERLAVPPHAIPAGRVPSALARFLGPEDTLTLLQDWHRRGKHLSQARVPDGALSPLSLSDDIVASILCARTVARARGVGLDLTSAPSTWLTAQTAALAGLSRPEQRLLQTLKDQGITTDNGCLHLSADEGRLRAYSIERRNTVALDRFLYLTADR